MRLRIQCEEKEMWLNGIPYDAWSGEGDVRLFRWLPWWHQNVSVDVCRGFTFVKFGANPWRVQSVSRSSVAIYMTYCRYKWRAAISWHHKQFWIVLYLMRSHWVTSVGDVNLFTYVILSRRNLSIKSPVVRTAPQHYSNTAHLHSTTEIQHYSTTALQHYITTAI